MEFQTEYLFSLYGLTFSATKKTFLTIVRQTKSRIGSATVFQLWSLASTVNLVNFTRDKMFGFDEEAADNYLYQRATETLPWELNNL